MLLSSEGILMPRKASAETPEDRAIREIDDEDSRYLERAALEAGPPADVRRLSERDEDDIWGIEDPLAADPNMLAQRLMTQGLPPEEAQQFQIVQQRPEWLELLATPTQSAETADMLARAIRFPWRWSLLEDIDDPDEQVATAERLNRRFQRNKTGEQQYEADAAMPAPQLPEMGV